MASNEEKLRVLNMIEQGKISAEDGARLLEALSGAQQRPQPETRALPAGSPRWLRVRVSDIRTGKNKVNVNIPVGLVAVGIKMGARFAPQLESAALDQIGDMIRSGATGKLIEVEDAEDGERVEIFVE